MAVGEIKTKYLKISNFNSNLIAIEKFDCIGPGLIVLIHNNNYIFVFLKIYYEYVIDINGRKLERRTQLTRCDNSTRKINFKIESGQQAILSFKL